MEEAQQVGGPDGHEELGFHRSQWGTSEDVSQGMTSLYLPFKRDGIGMPPVREARWEALAASQVGTWGSQGIVVVAGIDKDRQEAASSGLEAGGRRSHLPDLAFSVKEDGGGEAAESLSRRNRGRD